MAQSINLIPREEKFEQRKEKVVRLSSVLTILLLLIVAGVAAFYWYRVADLKSDIKKADNRTEALRTDIKGLSDIEITARSLDAKYNILNDIYTNRRKYSVLLSELQRRVPEGVAIETVTVAGETSENLNISGEGPDYISIAKLINTLSDTKYASATPGYEEMFSNVTLNSVTFDAQDSTVSYFIVTKFNEALLK